MATSNNEGTAEGPSVARPDPHGIIEWVRNIYADGEWNATPDIAHWRGNYYVVFDHGTVHPGYDGPAMVLRSSNLQEWEHIYTTSSSAVDCKLLALPDRLFLYYLYWEPGLVELTRQTGDRNYVETRVVYTEDGQSWSEPQRVHEPLHNFWRPKVHDGVVYVASDALNIGRTDYQTREEQQPDSDLHRVDLLRSADGLAWEKVSTIVEGRGVKGKGVTETEIVFWPDGELWALVRQDILARARPPYLNWTIWSAGIGNQIGGPAIIRIGNDLYAGGRFYGLGNNKDGNPQLVTSLWKYDEAAEGFERIADLPKAAYADCGYPGFVATEDGVYVVYYSGYTYGETDAAHWTKADIYLAKLNIGKGDLHP